MTPRHRLVLLALLLSAGPGTVLHATPAGSVGSSVRGGWEVGFSTMLRPSVNWSAHSAGALGYYFGAGASALIVPFPVDMSASSAETLTSYILFHPELSGFVGVRASIFDFVEFRLELNVGGDIYVQWAGLTIPAYGVHSTAAAFAVTPWVWVRPTLRINVGSPFDVAWLKRLSLEASAVVALGNLPVVSERFRWEIALLWRP
jgi:hypothetical protein